MSSVKNIFYPKSYQPLYFNGSVFVYQDAEDLLKPVKVNEDSVCKAMEIIIASVCCYMSFLFEVGLKQY